MTITQQIEQLLDGIKEQSNSLHFGNIDFIIINNNITRVDIRSSIKTEVKETSQ